MMLSIIIIFLVIAQCLSFYFIVLLNLKISSLKEVEEKQQRMKDDMDDAIGAYLAEMKDENNRLIQEMKTIKKQSTNNSSSFINKQDSSMYTKNTADRDDEIETIQNNFKVPKAYVKKAYQTKQSDENKLTVEEQVIQMYKKGLSISDIAKRVNRGKTEIELLLKFQQ